MTIRRITLIALTLTALAAAQSPAAAPVPKPVTASVAAQNRILKAEHDLDSVVAQENQMQMQFQQLQKAYQDAEAKRPTLNKAVADAIDEAWKDSGLSREEYTFDPANFTFAARDKAAAPKPATK